MCPPCLGSYLKHPQWRGRTPRSPLREPINNTARYRKELLGEFSILFLTLLLFYINRFQGQEVLSGRMYTRRVQAPEFNPQNENK